MQPLSCLPKVWWKKVIYRVFGLLILIPQAADAMSLLESLDQTQFVLTSCGGMKIIIEILGANQK